ncbi:MAG: SH3 domain-containing protein [Saprospiraceae bacterium]|nr:SH3 domain-containing protein [Saprospiraceae bacterium]
MIHTRFISLLLLASCLNYPLNAQVFSCNCGEVRVSKVTAPSGLVLREQPSKDSKRVLAIPFEDVVTVCEIYSPENEQVNLEGIGWGRWQRVMYQGKEGFVFDHYLDGSPLYEVFHGDYIDLPGTLPEPVIAICAEKPAYYGHLNLLLNPVKIIKNSSSVGDSYPALEGKYQEVAKFYVCGLQPKIKSVFGYVSEYHGKDEILPGYYHFMEAGNNRFMVYATGEVVVEQSDSPNISEEPPFLKIQNYKVYFQDLNKPNEKGQLIYSSKSVYLNRHEHGSGIMALDFSGDLDGDGIPDLIMNEAGSNYSLQLLFLSSKAEKGFLLKLVRKVTIACC